MSPDGPTPRGTSRGAWTLIGSGAAGVGAVVCDDHPGAVVAGDFNSTVDHRPVVATIEARQ
ncbi:MAG: hypothetical protein AAGC49_09595 [Brevundimonas sp.]